MLILINNRWSVWQKRKRFQILFSIKYNRKFFFVVCYRINWSRGHFREILIIIHICYFYKRWVVKFHEPPPPEHNFGCFDISTQPDVSSPHLTYWTSRWRIICPRPSRRNATKYSFMNTWYFFLIPFSRSTTNYWLIVNLNHFIEGMIGCFLNTWISRISYLRCLTWFFFIII